jgi:drug/metabolite transporter (DMT)-like permease
MTPFAFLQLSVATAMFIIAGVVAKSWTLDGATPKFVAATLIYMAGNFVMMRLLRQVGMSAAFSLTNVLQLVVLSLIGLLVFKERVGFQQGAGIVFAVIGVVLISFAPPVEP